MVSTLAARLARLGREITEEQEHEIKKASADIPLNSLTGGLLNSIDPDIVFQKTVEKFKIPTGEEPTDNQIEETERELMTDALKPFHNPKLRDTVLSIKASLEQVIDETTRDKLLAAGFDAEAKEKAVSLLDDFRKFIEENKDEIEAIKILYNQPYRDGLRYHHVKELAAAIRKPPLSIHYPEQSLWKAYEAVEPEKVKGKGGKSLIDIVALVRHAIHPNDMLIPVEMGVSERYRKWLVEQETAGVTFSPEQRKWLDAIKDHIASSLSIDQDDFEYAPFSQFGGLGKAYKVFDEKLSELLVELNERLAA